jgi:hypothetical protein
MAAPPIDIIGVLATFSPEIRLDVRLRFALFSAYPAPEKQPSTTLCSDAVEEYHCPVSSRWEFEHGIHAHCGRDGTRVVCGGLVDH